MGPVGTGETNATSSTAGVAQRLSPVNWSMVLNRQEALVRLAAKPVFAFSGRQCCSVDFGKLSNGRFVSCIFVSFCWPTVALCNPLIYLLLCDMNLLKRYSTVKAAKHAKTVASWGEKKPDFAAEIKDTSEPGLFNFGIILHT